MNYESGTFDNDGRLLPPEGAEGGRRRLWWIIGGILAVVIVLGAYFAFAGGKSDGAAKAKAARAEQLPNVTVITARQQAVPNLISATGTLAAKREMPVGVAGEGGMVTAVLVEPGQWVRAGQVLATIDRQVQVQSAASLAAQLNVARADAALAESELQRARQLVERGFISRADLERRTATRDAALARVSVAQAALGEQRARNGRLDIRAPASGLVLTRAVEPGQIVSAGSGTLFRIAKDGQMELRADLAEGDLAGLPVGSPATVTPVGQDRRFAGEVWQVSPVIDPQTRQGVARVALPYDPALRPGGFASAEIRGGVTQAPLLPESSVMSDEQGNFVYVVGKDDKVERRTVKVGDVSDVGAVVLSGLNGGERIVRSAGAFLNPGQKIKPILDRKGS